jgi:hypothetical protein
LQIRIFNIGAYDTNAVDFVMRRTIPGQAPVVINVNFPKGIAYDTVLNFRIGIDKILSKGVNTFEATIDAGFAITENNELNNTLAASVNIVDEDMTPVWPYNYSIVTDPNPTLVASTFEAFAPSRQYLIQIDTTALFNSPAKQTHTVITAGGSVEWKPTLNLTDSTVCYWRTAKDTLYGNSSHNWTTYSFVFLQNGSPGWNQSHYFQYLPNSFSTLRLGSNREFAYDSSIATVTVRNTCQSNPAPFNYQYTDFKVAEGNNLTHSFGCNFNEIQFIIVDPKTGKVMRNLPQPGGGTNGLWGSRYPSCGRESDKFFEFLLSDTASRRKMKLFIDSIPSGMHVAVFPLLRTTDANGRNKVFARQLANDTIYSQFNNYTIYHKLKDLGFSQIDSFNTNKPWVFWFIKDGPIGQSSQHMAKDSTEIVEVVRSFNIADVSGTMQSKIVGRAKKWNSFKKLGYAADGQTTDVTAVDIFGIDAANVKTYLCTVSGNDTSLAFINANTYPNIQLVYQSKDTIQHSAEQLHYWRVLFDPSVDLALSPNIAFSMDSSLTQGQPQNLVFAVKNVSGMAVDSTSVWVEVADAQNNLVQGTNVPLPALAAYESKVLTHNFSTATTPGANTLYINVNKQRTPQENSYLNNVGLRTYSVGADNLNPILDVTFDGVHIANGDLVSARPYILAKIKDENRYLKLDDTAGVECYLKYPNTFEDRRIYFNDTMYFEAAKAGVDKDNAAYVHFKPYLTQDGVYDFSINAKDKTGNISAQQSYKISFKVINQQMASNLLNYPNPFSTSTRFVFTLTGYEVPDNMKIQILSATGRVVREITKDELGPIRIGRNMTEYAWDGTDQFGDKLGNGVYFYHFVTSHRGKDVTRYANADVDEFIKKGMGKLVIMR